MCPFPVGTTERDVKAKDVGEREVAVSKVLLLCNNQIKSHCLSCLTKCICFHTITTVCTPSERISLLLNTDSIENNPLILTKMY